MKDLFGNEVLIPVEKYGTSPVNIISSAIEEYNPVKVLLMFSGGHDSLVSSHLSANILSNLGVDFEVYHGDTTIGIPETQEFVKSVCNKFQWKLNIRRPPNPEDWYDNIVKNYGFPGPTKQSHAFMYRRLKERALRQFVTHVCKSSPKVHENVLLISGTRKTESVIRMGYKTPVHKEDSRVWCNPIFYWSERRCKHYMEIYGLPKKSC